MGEFDMRKKMGSLLLCLSLLSGRALGKEEPKVDTTKKSVNSQYVKDAVCSPRTLFELLLACGLGYSYLNKGKSKKSFGNLDISNQGLNFNGIKPKKDKFVVDKKIDLEFSGKSVKPPKPFSSEYERQVRRIMGLNHIFDFEINCKGWEEIEFDEKIIFVDIPSEDSLVPLFSRVYKFPQKVVKGSYKFGNEYIAEEFPLNFSKPRYLAENYFGDGNFELMSCKKKLYSEDKCLILEEYRSKTGLDSKGVNVANEVFVVGYFGNCYYSNYFAI